MPGSPPGSPPGSAPAALPKVLVVEDEPTLADAVAARLRAEGFDVDVAGDGLAAVTRAAEWQPALVVLDLMLPGSTASRCAGACRPSGRCPY
jgi:DNA-binding response OmpR family regulator